MTEQFYSKKFPDRNVNRSLPKMAQEFMAALFVIKKLKMPNSIISRKDLLYIYISEYYRQ